MSEHSIEPRITEQRRLELGLTEAIGQGYEWTIQRAAAAREAARKRIEARLTQESNDE